MSDLNSDKDVASSSQTGCEPDPGIVEVERGNESDISPPRGHGFPVVGIGGSAGALEAITRLLQALPNDTNMAFVIVQHLDPHHASQLAEILAKSTAMPVQNVEDGISIRPNEVYVIPPNTTMVLEDGVLRLAPRDPGLHLPIDAFFRSLARVQGSRAIGIVLSGNASDGSEGVRAIKEECGLTFAQDEASAQHVGMPRNAIATGAIDYVLPPEDIAHELASLSRHPFVRPPQQDQAEVEILPDGGAELARIFHILRNRTKIDFTHYKPNTIRRRIGRRMIVKRTKHLGAYAEFLEHHPDEVRELYRDLLICVTNFFRDQEVFTALRQLLKDILQSRNADEPFRVWVPGCATGEEVYSLAICLRDLTDELRLNTTVQLFGTDISDLGLDRARAATYPESIAEHVSPEQLRRFFVRVDGGHQVSKLIRESCVFARQDVTSDPPFGHMDLISCRNVLIYMDSALQRQVLPIFHYSLNPTGLLLLGTAESIGTSSDLFSVVDAKRRIYGRKPAPLRLALNLPVGRVSSDDPTPVRSRVTLGGLDLQRKADLVIQSKYAPASVVIDADLQILYFRGKTGFYLEPMAGEATFHLLRMAREGLVTPLRRAVETAAKQNVSVVERGLTVEYLGEQRDVTIEVTPIPGASPEERYFVVVFQEPGAPARTLPTFAPASGDATEYATSLETQNHELQRQVAELREQLRNANEDHEAHTEELRASNEEVRSANEELQSTNEELGTTKEELQSANEELTTLNEELQTRNTELNVASSDLRNLLAAVYVSFLIVDEDLRLRRFSGAAEKLLDIKAVDIGYPLVQLQCQIDFSALQPQMRTVIDTLKTEQWDIQDKAGRWFSVTARPYRTVENRIAGVVIVFVDIDPLKKTLHAAEEARDNADRLVETIREPLVVLDSDFRIQRATSAFYDTFRVSRAETEGRFLYDLGNGQWNNPRLRELLGEALFRNQPFEDFEIDQQFPYIGRRTMRLNGRRISIDDDQRRMLLLAIEDVTVRREQAEMRYQRLFEAAKDGILIVDAESERVVDVNPFVFELTGYGRELWVGRRLAEVDAFLNKDAAAGIVSEARSSEVVRYDRMYLRDRAGRSRQADMIANRYSIGGQQIVQINIRDVTARNEAFETLRKSEERFRLFVDSVKDYALVQLDIDGNISSWNTGAERMLRYTEREIIGKPFSILFTPEDRAREKPTEELEGARVNGASEDERWHVKKDGSRFFASGILTTVRSEAGELRGFAKIMRDVTDRKKADEQLRTSLLEKEVLLKEVHHRVKNNLQIIASLLNLQGEFVADPQARTMLETMNTRVRSIAAIHELLYRAEDLSHIDFVAYLQTLTRDVLAVYSTRDRVRVEVEAEPALLEITQAVPCGLIVNELLTNALKHAFPGERGGSIRVAFQALDKDYAVEVRDNGIGLPEDANPQNARSLGFQLLSLLVQQLNGRLAIDRSSGSRFTVTFPLKDGKHAGLPLLADSDEEA
jgi:two-component system CheB/CheR fusion protein